MWAACRCRCAVALRHSYADLDGVRFGEELTCIEGGILVSQLLCACWALQSESFTRTIVVLAQARVVICELHGRSVLSTQ